jgi:hypothetical protein
MPAEHPGTVCFTDALLSESRAFFCILRLICRRRKNQPSGVVLELLQQTFHPHHAGQPVTFLGEESDPRFEDLQRHGDRPVR